MTLATALDVARPAARGSLAVPADVATVAAVGALATAVVVVALAATERDVGVTVRRRTTVATALVAVVAAGLRIAEVQQLVGDLGVVLGTRRVVGALALVVVGGLLLAVTTPAAGLRSRDQRLAAVVIGVALLGAAAVAGPRAGSTAALATTAGLVALAVAVTGAVVVVLPAGARGRVGELLGMLTVVALVATWPAMVRSTSHDSFTASLALGEGEVYVTMAPAAPGPNEVHVYVFGPDGAPLPVSGGAIEVAGVGARSMTQAGVGHLLAFAVPLPEEEEWMVTFRADTAGSGTLSTSTAVPAGGNA